MLPAEDQMKGAMKYAYALLPYILLLSYGWALTHPLFQGERKVFTREISGDGIISAWVYDSVARTVADFQVPFYHWDLDYPNPLTRIDHAPGLMDAILAAPITLAFDWPAQLGAVQGATIILMGLSLAILAAVMGLRFWGVVVAGALGMSMWPQWYQLEHGRLNTAWPALAFLAVAAYLALLKSLDRKEARREPLKIGLYFGLSVILGWFLLATYPPYALMLAPAAAVILFLPLWRSGFLGAGLLLLSLGLGLGLAYQDMQYLLQWRSDNAFGVCTQIQCPRMNQILPFSLAARWGPSQSSPLLTFAGMAVGSWCLVPLAALFSRRRIIALMLTAGAAASLLLAFGPCWSEEMASMTGMVQTRGGADWELALWCRLRNINDYARFALIGMGGLALVSALAMDGLSQRFGKVGWIAAGLLTLGVAAQSGWIMASDFRFAENWSAVPMTPSAQFLEKQEVGVVAELPFDSSRQFMTILDAPQHRWVNPLNTVLMRESGDPFVEWLKVMGLEKLPETQPTLEQAKASGVRWILLEPTRCPGGAQGEICREGLPRAIEALLGPPDRGPQGLMIWEIEGAAPAK